MINAQALNNPTWQVIFAKRSLFPSSNGGVVASPNIDCYVVFKGQGTQPSPRCTSQPSPTRSDAGAQAEGGCSAHGAQAGELGLWPPPFRCAPPPVSKLVYLRPLLPQSTMATMELIPPWQLLFQINRHLHRSNQNFASNISLRHTVGIPFSHFQRTILPLLLCQFEL
jgi:hypothetical protein